MPRCLSPILYLFSKVPIDHQVKKRGIRFLTRVTIENPYIRCFFYEVLTTGSSELIWHLQ